MFEVSVGFDADLDWLRVAVHLDWVLMLRVVVTRTVSLFAKSRQQVLLFI